MSSTAHIAQCLPKVTTVAKGTTVTAFKGHCAERVEQIFGRDGRKFGVNGSDFFQGGRFTLGDSKKVGWLVRSVGGVSVEVSSHLKNNTRKQWTHLLFIGAPRKRVARFGVFA